jgi:hypothetical protein
MNKADTNELTEYWNRETRYVNDKVDEAFKDAQDHAYALGLKRGKEEVTDLAKRLVAARDAEDQREWVAILDALYKVGAGATATEGITPELSGLTRPYRGRSARTTGWPAPQRTQT